MSTAPVSKRVGRSKEYGDLPPLLADAAHLMQRHLAKKNRKLLTINISWAQQSRLKKMKKKKSAEFFRELDEPIQEKKTSKESVGQKATKTGDKQKSAESTARGQSPGEVQTAEIRAIPTGESYSVAREASPKK